MSPRPRGDAKRVAFVAHCLLNQNAMVAELPRFPGVIYPVVNYFRKQGYLFEQLEEKLKATASA